MIALYSRSLTLYPWRFKSRFADEMHTVFRDSVADAVVEGSLSLILLCGKEFTGMPFSILKEFWYEIQGEDLNMEELSLAPIKPGSWVDSFWAGLPHLLIAILFATSSAMANTGLGTISGIVFGLLLLAGFLVTIYFTWRNHWPAWSASWYGYIGIVVLLFSTLPVRDWVGVAESVFEAIRIFILVLCLLTLLYWLSRRNPIEGLLMAMPVVILFWIPVLEFIPNSIRFWLTFWLFLLPALTATAVARLNDIRKAVWLVLGASLLIGLPIAYAQTYWNNIPVEYSSSPSIDQFIKTFSVPWLSSGALILGPILGWGLWSLGRKYGKIGFASAILVVTGMVINLFGHFSYWWWFSKITYLDALLVFKYYQPTEASSTFMVHVGLAIMFVGSIGLAALNWKRNKLFSVALILVPVVLPVVARLTTYFGYYVNVAGTSLQIGRLDVIYQVLALLAGVSWLVLSGWTIPRLYSPYQSEGTT